ncbi:putative sister chromatid cohesion protein DCC1-like [Apostichopus japonicus]|uniref:Sister chromatid cohesion protein DCC1 n=1 Tax=Stichopus japonicus TaxID=307972 RepID=A0A2G8K278_STIJA|nr:putative sister chromatid cohesion protein DCC1-like [Apostichopus japonicus]
MQFSSGNLKQVTAISVVAKLDPNDLIGQPQCLYFGDSFHTSNMKLVEVDSSVMDYVEEGKNLIIRGYKKESAVLCLDGVTFDLKEAQTSNTLLLLDKCFCSPEDFQENETDIHHFESSHSGPKFTDNDLLDVVQASQKEIRAELKKLRACCVNGFWRLLDFDYEFEVLSQILSLIDENSWKLDEVPQNEMIETLQNLKPRFILQHVLDCFGEKKSEASVGFASSSANHTNSSHNPASNLKQCGRVAHNHRVFTGLSSPSFVTGLVVTASILMGIYCCSTCAVVIIKSRQPRSSATAAVPHQTNQMAAMQPLPTSGQTAQTAVEGNPPTYQEVMSSPMNYPPPGTQSNPAYPPQNYPQQPTATQPAIVPYPTQQAPVSLPYPGSPKPTATNYCPIPTATHCCPLPTATNYCSLPTATP